jgi:hypothetical protein
MTPLVPAAALLDVLGRRRAGAQTAVDRTVPTGNTRPLPRAARIACRHGEQAARIEGEVKDTVGFVWMRD